MALGEEAILLFLKLDPDFPDLHFTHEPSFVVSLFLNKKLLSMLRRRFRDHSAQDLKNFHTENADD
jgi:hypothetical protein